MIKLITTDSYFELFPILTRLLKDKVNTLSGKNLIFCEEKVSLMAERSVVSEYNGSFNTAVYSFGNYLRAKKPLANALTKEGSAMAVKRVLSSLPLTCFKASRTTLAPALYDLIIQLKSAKVKPSDLITASRYAVGTLKNKLVDIASVYEGYEQFILERGLDDQSSMLSYLPEIISGDEQIKQADVYIVGFNGFTSQIRSAILALLHSARSVTAILTAGENQMVYVNETASSFGELVKEAGLPLLEEKVQSRWEVEAKIIADNLFNPQGLTEQKYSTDKIYTLLAENRAQECERVAEIIRAKVLSGECRYKDITVALPDPIAYSGDIERAFSMLEIPYFLDQKKKVSAHPLIRLIISYVDAFRKNLQKSALSEFYKNPLFSEDKAVSDEFENYCLKYNVDFNRIKKPFVFDDEGGFDLAKLNDFRFKVVDCFTSFNPKGLLKQLAVEERLAKYSKTLADMGEMEEKAVNEQIYSAVDGVLSQMEMMLGGLELELIEFKKVFLSGVSAMELSIIPQYNDAVFVGGLKETALAKAKYLFALGLSSEVPAIKDDVSLLSDSDIDALKEIKVLVEPKIRVVNHRARENTALALSAFERGLYLSCPLLSVSGDKIIKSQVLSQIEQTFTVKPFPDREGYLSYKQGLNAFARDAGDFATGRIDDFTLASSFYSAVGEEGLDRLLDRAKKEVKLRLDASRQITSKKYLSPTRIEDFYKCPYRAFLSNALKLKKREEGVVDGFSVGNVMHEIFKEYALRMNEEVTDKASSDRLVKRIAEELTSQPEYARYLSDAVTASAVDGAVNECAKFCYKNYLAIKNSSFKVSKTEASFGDGKGCEYPAIELDGGRVKLQGKIDRVDESGEYFRILDYKTANSNADLDLLFTGKKLQLYLYAKAVSQKLKNGKLAGVYYMPISDGFIKEGEKEPALSNGRTLADEGCIALQDATALQGQGLFLPVKIKNQEVTVEGQATEAGLNAMMDYAVAMSELAVKRMGEGVIAPSPCDGRICGYCEYKSLCPLFEPDCREHGKVDEATVIKAVRGEE